MGWDMIGMGQWVTDLMSSGLVVTGFSIAARQNIWIEASPKVNIAHCTVHIAHCTMFTIHNAQKQ